MLFNGVLCKLFSRSPFSRLGFLRFPLIRPVNESRRDGMPNWIPFVSENGRPTAFPTGVIHLSDSLFVIELYADKSIVKPVSIAVRSYQ